MPLRIIIHYFLPPLLPLVCRFASLFIIVAVACRFASLSIISCHPRCCMAFSLSQTSQASSCPNVVQFVPSLKTRRASLTLTTWRRSLSNCALIIRDPILVINTISKILYVILFTLLSIILIDANCKATQIVDQCVNRHQERSAFFQGTSARIRCGPGGLGLGDPTAPA